MRRQKEKLINSPKSMRQFGRWPRKRQTVGISWDLSPQDRVTEFQRHTWNSQIKCAFFFFKIKKSEVQKGLAPGTLATFPSSDVVPLPWDSNHLKVLCHFTNPVNGAYGWTRDNFNVFWLINFMEKPHTFQKSPMHLNYDQPTHQSRRKRIF